MIVLVTAIVAPDYWVEFFRSLFSNVDQPQYFSLPPPAPIRIPLAIVVIWGARTDRPWAVPIAATLALPIIWPHGPTVALAAIPFLRRGDRAARTGGWENAASPRRLGLLLAAFVGGALILALLLTNNVRELMDSASAGLRPYAR